MIDERKLDGLAHQYAYNELGSSPCEDCDKYDFKKCFQVYPIIPNLCEEATIYNEKYWKLVEEYKAKFNKK